MRLSFAVTKEKKGLGQMRMGVQEKVLYVPIPMASGEAGQLLVPIYHMRGSKAQANGTTSLSA